MVLVGPGKLVRMRWSEKAQTTADSDWDYVDAKSLGYVEARLAQMLSLRIGDSRTEKFEWRNEEVEEALPFAALVDDPCSGEAQLVYSALNYDRREESSRRSSVTSDSRGARVGVVVLVGLELRLAEQVVVGTLVASRDSVKVVM